MEEGRGDPVLAIVAGASRIEMGPLSYEAVPRDRYLLVRYYGQVATLEIAERWFDDLDRRLADNAMSQILWDSRPARGHPSSVRERIWAWLEEARVLKRSAIVVESEMLRVSANLSSVGGKLNLRAFRSFEDAEAWLQTAPPGAAGEE